MSLRAGSTTTARNILVHGYDAIDDRIVWGVIEDELDGLLEDVATLLGLSGPDARGAGAAPVEAVGKLCVSTSQRGAAAGFLPHVGPVWLMAGRSACPTDY